MTKKIILKEQNEFLEPFFAQANSTELITESQRRSCGKTHLKHNVTKILLVAVKWLNQPETLPL